MKTELQNIYDSEINVEISWFWDAASPLSSAMR